MQVGGVVSLLDSSPDALLAARAADGDESAFAVIVRRHGSYLRAFAARMLRSTSDADDVVQEALIIAWRRLPDLEDPSALRSWLTTIVSRKVTERARSAKPWTPIDDLELEGPASGPEESAVTSSRMHALDRVLRALPDDQRQIWVLREIAGYSYVQIAERLDTSAPTVRGRLARARATVLEQMSEWR
jgi:RNA polymerase sigma-70 factor (ECF subfamily)